MQKNLFDVVCSVAVSLLSEKEMLENYNKYLT
jgi:hypothetical protein